MLLLRIFKRHINHYGQGLPLCKIDDKYQGLLFFIYGNQQTERKFNLTGDWSGGEDLRRLLSSSWRLSDGNAFMLIHKRKFACSKK